MERKGNVNKSKTIERKSGAAILVQRIVSQPDIRHLARANGALVESHRNRNGELPDGMEMAAFMAVFHPNIKGKKLKALVADQRPGGKG